MDIWHGVVWITLASSASYILRDEAEWNIARTLLADIRTTRVVVTNCQGDTVYERDTGLLNRKFFYPLKVVFCDPKRTNWPSRMITLDATGLGGSDLPSLSKADIIVRTDKHKQNIYGPSMSTVETVTKSHAWGRTVSAALGISKAAHEFLVSHYFATDSIPFWNAFIQEVMPSVPLTTPAVRRAEVEELFCEEPILHPPTGVSLITLGRMLFHSLWTCCSALGNVGISIWPECGNGQPV